MESTRNWRRTIAHWMFDCVIFALGLVAGAMCWRHGQPGPSLPLLCFLGACLTLLALHVVFPWLSLFAKRHTWTVELLGCISWAAMAAVFWRNDGFSIWVVCCALWSVYYAIDVARELQRASAQLPDSVDGGDHAHSL